MTLKMLIFTDNQLLPFLFLRFFLRVRFKRTLLERFRLLHEPPNLTAATFLALSLLFFAFCNPIRTVFDIFLAAIIMFFRIAAALEILNVEVFFGEVFFSV